MYAILLRAIGPLLDGLAWLFRTQLGQWILGAMAFLGIKFFVTDNAVDALLSFVSAKMAGIGADAAAWAGYLNFDKYVSIIVSAYGAVMAKRLVLRKV